MQPRSRLRISIGQWTALVAALAFFLSLPRQKTTADFQLVAGVAALLPIFFFVSVVIDALVGIQCPGCGRWSLRRLALASSFYRCAQCGSRYKRSGLGPWRDASGPEYAATFRGKNRARSWLGFAIPQAEGDWTTSRLLRNRRRRQGPGEGAAAAPDPLPRDQPGPHDP
jgi:hypothetical protein